MQFRIADTFQKALGKLTAQEQSAVKITVFDLQTDPSNPGLKFHRIDKSKDQNFWSIRANRDIRIIVHKTASSFLVAYVDHHNDAYNWAERRRIEEHPKTGAMQIVEVRELVDEQVVFHTAYGEVAAASQKSETPKVFESLTEVELFELGVPEDWVEDIKNANEDEFLVLYEHLPQEAAEALLEFAATGILPEITKVVADDPYNHPDAQRRFRIMEGQEELEKALAAPWEQWAVFLHPMQRSAVDADYDGPARVSGTAGTGKTIVTLHRAARILRENPDARILISTFSEPLSNLLKHKFKILTGIDADHSSQVTIEPFFELAKSLFAIQNGYEPRVARAQLIDSLLATAAEVNNLTEFPINFLKYEWANVIDPWQISSIEEYKNVRRIGRRGRLGEKQRERLWPIFESVQRQLSKDGYSTPSDVYAKVAIDFAKRETKPFSHIFLDECQDLGVPELRMFASLMSNLPNSLFFSGDIGQRIFKEPFSWLNLGVDVRGRSKSLKVNYRTSFQIKSAADRLMPENIDDVDGLNENRNNSISLFNGEQPQIVEYDSSDAEIMGTTDVIVSLLSSPNDNIGPEEIAIFVRSNDQLKLARSVCKAANVELIELSSRVEEKLGKISIGTMHYAKGLEYRAVFIMGCDEDVVPNLQRIEGATDVMDLDEIYATERHLLYVAATRAREKLTISGVSPLSEFLDDIEHSIEG